MPKALTIKVPSKGEVQLTEQDALHSGGEGTVYKKHRTAYKIYHDPAKAIAPDKVKELQPLSVLANILGPKELIFDKFGQLPLGYTMALAPAKTVLCELFTTSFRDRNGITPDDTMALVEAMKAGIIHVHNAKCLIVDCNEFNFLVGPDFRTPYFIDVDSYQTPSFKATALMPSVRDWQVQNNNFTQLSDWFSFGVLAVELFLGIHPYKGRHPDFEKKDFVGRMQKGVSIFNKKVTLPPAARDFSHIPKEYMDWLVKVMEDGKRMPPPGMPGALSVQQTRRLVFESTDNYEFMLMWTFEDDIIGCWYQAGRTVVATKKHLYVDGVKAGAYSPGVSIFFSAAGDPYRAFVKDGKLVIQDNKTNLIEPNIAAEELLVVDNTLYAKFEGKLFEIEPIELGSGIRFPVKATWDIMPNSSRIFRGVIVQEMLGSMAVMIPLPEPGKTYSRCITKIIHELTGYKVLDAKRDGRVVVLAVAKGSDKKTVVIRFDQDYQTYDFRECDDQSGTVNFVTLVKGIVIMINGEDDSLELFRHDVGMTNNKVIKDPAVDSSMTLSRTYSDVRVFKGNRLYRLKMK